VVVFRKGAADKSAEEAGLAGTIGPHHSDFVFRLDILGGMVYFINHY
jgi:hypothetical protein